MKRCSQLNNQGSLLVLLGAIAFSLGGLLIKLIPLDPFTINALRCVFSSIVIGGYLYLSKHKLVINKTTIIGALFVRLMMMTYVVANKLTSAANAIVLEYTAPILVIVFEAIFFSKKPDKLSVIMCGLVVSGVAIVVLDGAGKGNLIGDTIALLSGVFYALTMMLNDFENSDSLSSVFLGHLFTAFTSIFYLDNIAAITPRTLLLIGALGIFQAGLGYTLLTLGLKKCEPLTGSLIACVEPVLNPILVALFYGEYMSFRQITGCVIVIGSIIVYNIYTSKKKQDI